MKDFDQEIYPIILPPTMMIKVLPTEERSVGHRYKINRKMSLITMLIGRDRMRVHSIGNKERQFKSSIKHNSI